MHVNTKLVPYLAILVFGCGGLLSNGPPDASARDGDIADGGRPIYVEQVCVGQNYGCALTGANDVQCWGSNDYGQLGQRTTGLPASPRPVKVPNLPSGVKQLACSSRNVCIRLATGAVMCWGDNSFGQAGNGNVSPASDPGTTPSAVDGLSDAVDLEAQAWAICALRATGDVMCWGSSNDCDLGSYDGYGPAVPRPVMVSGIVGASVLTTQLEGAFVDHATGDTSCWGPDSFGIFGDGQAHGIVCPAVACPHLNGFSHLKF